MPLKKSLEELRKIRAEGKTTRDFDFDEEKGRIYDEYDEEEYKDYQRKRIRNEKFVVDDDDTGYVYHGEDEWAPREEPEQEQSNTKKNNAIIGPKMNSIESLFKSSKAKSNQPKPVLQSTKNVDDILGKIGKDKSLNRTPDSSIRTPNSSLKRGLGSGLRSGLRSGLGNKVRKQTSQETPTRSASKVQSEREPMIGGSIPDFNLSGKQQESRETEEEKEKVSEPVGDLACTSPAPTSDGHMNDPSHARPSTDDLDKNKPESTSSDKMDIDEELTPPPLPSSPQSGSSIPEAPLSSLPALSSDHISETLQYKPPSNNSTDIQTRKVTPGETIRMYWVDFYENRSNVILFGKSAEGESCTVMVDKVWRDLYFEPTSPDQMDSLKIEIFEFQNRHSKDSQFMCKTVKLTDCFSKDKNEHEYLYVRYPLGITLPPKKGQNYTNFRGDTFRPIECFIVSKSIMGPCWLDIKVNNTASMLSWTGFSFTADCANVRLVQDSTLAPPPPMSMLSLSVTTKPTEKNEHEIVGISYRYFPKVAHDAHQSGAEIKSVVVTGIRPANDGLFPVGFKDLAQAESKAGAAVAGTPSKPGAPANAPANASTIVLHKNERALIMWFFETLVKLDPDVFIGHSLTDVHLATILTRANNCNINEANRLGRFRQSQTPKTSSEFDILRMCTGRLILDLKNGYGLELLKPLCQEFTLDEICKNVLGCRRKPFNSNLQHGGWLDKDAHGLLEAMKLNEKDTLYAFDIAQKTQMFQLSRQLTNLAGNTWRATLRGYRSDRNDYLLMHEFKRRNYLIPERDPKTTEKSTVPFLGGKVLDPEKGLHQQCILLLDFNSLYPSLIIEHNICFTTVDCDPSDVNAEADINMNAEFGILPQILKNLVERRKEVKKLISSNKQSSQSSEWDIRQKALKLTANSMYGCLGLPSSKFYAMPIARLVTMKGRETLLHTKELAEQSQLQVVYGDTDSVMIKTNTTSYDEAFKIGLEFKQKVNKQYRNMEIDIEEVFRELLMYAKKKYACYIMKRDNTYKLDIKGLDIRRREFCDYSKLVTKDLLNLIFTLGLTHGSHEIFEEVLKLLSASADKVRQNGYPSKMFIIRTQLSREVSAFDDSMNNKPHIKVAKELIKRGDQIKAKDVIGYIFAQSSGTDGEEAASASAPAGTNGGGGAPQAVPVEDLKDPERNLHVDYEYYLYHQLYTPVKRLIERFDGFDDERLAEAIGVKLKAKQNNQPFSNKIHDDVITQSGFFFTQSDEQRFANCEPPLFKHKDHEFEFHGVKSLSVDGLKCPECNDNLTTKEIKAQTRLWFDGQIKRYYEGWLVCDECEIYRNSVPLYASNKCRQSNCRGNLNWVFSAKDLYTEMSFLKSLFERPSNDKNNDSSLIVSANEELLNENLAIANGYLNASGYSYVNIGQFFQF